MAIANQGNALSQQRLRYGLGRLDSNGLDFQRAERYGEFQQAGQDASQEADINARLRAETTFNQIKQAGLAGLANQFRSTQRAIAFDTARRGTQGGSRQIERGAEAQGQVQAGVGNVLNQAQGAANSQLSQDRSRIFGFDQQLAGNDPFRTLSVQNQLQGFQQQANSATGQFDIGQQQENIRAGVADNRAANIFGAIDAAGTGAAGVVRNNADNRYINNLRTLQ